MPDLTLKEIVSAVIALAIASLTLYLLYSLYFYSSPNADAYQKASQVLQVAIALMGTVTGYYFGRIPAEAHAAGMQKIATTAQQTAQNAQARLADTAQQAATSASAATNAIEDNKRVVNQLNALRGQLANSPMGGGATPPAEVEYAIREIDRIMQQAIS